MTTITLPRAVVEQALKALEGAAECVQQNYLPDKCGHDWDEQIIALRAALAQQAEPELSRCPQCNGPADNGFDRSFPPSPYLCKKCMAEPVGPGAWVASKDGRVIYDDASTDDGLLRVSGDFENDEQRSRYAQRIVDKLNAALVAAAKDAEHQQTLALQQRSYEREIQLEVEAEREACAKLCEDYDDDRGTGETWGPRFAAIIRARTP